VREGSKSKNFDRFFTVEMAVRQCVGNALPLAGVNHAASQQRITQRVRTRVGFARSIFFALKTRAGSVARADSCSTSSTRSAWRSTSPESGTAVCGCVEKAVKKKTLDSVENFG
jgi:hypothetical protein